MSLERGNALPRVLSALDQDLSRYTSHGYADGYEAFKHDVQIGEGESIVLSTYDHANSVIAEPGADLSPDSARYRLTKRAVELARHKNRLRPVEDEEDEENTLFGMACIEAELRLVRSLGLHTERPADPTRPPAVVMLDSEGQPFGYQKINGMPSVYVWRQAQLVTEAGTYTVPADCFIAVHYAEAADPRQRYCGLGLVALNNSCQPPDQAYLLRFGSSLLPRVIREVSYTDMSDERAKLIPYIPLALYMTPQHISRRVAWLLSAGRAVFV